MKIQLSPNAKRLLSPLRVLIKPIDSFAEFKYKNGFSVGASIIILILFFLSSIFEYLKTGPGFNNNNPNELNLFIKLASTVFLFILWSVSNYLFCTLMDGKGFFKEVWCASAYALLPYIIMTFVSTAATNVIITEEYTFVVYAQAAGIIWSSVLLLIALKSIHDYSMTQTVISVLLSVLGIAVAIFILLLTFTVYQQVFNIFRTIFNEIMFRL